MASSEQSIGFEKSLDGTSSASQTQAKETSHTQSHVADVRGPESVYDIDEETRMGPEMTNDGVTPPVSVMNTCLKKQEGNKAETVSTAEDEEAAYPSPHVRSSFSALSFIAAEYAESDTSSPSSTNSPPAVGGSCAPSASEEATNQSSDGFDTSSVPAQLKDQGEAHSFSLDSGGDAPRLCSTPDGPERVLDEMTGKMVDLKKESKEDKELAVAGQNNSAAATECVDEDGAEGTPALLTNPDNGDSTSQPEPMETEDSKEDDKVETPENDMLSFKDNQDTNRSMTDMSEDSKQVFNLDSALSGWQEESPESSMALKLVKGPGSVLFGENANSSMPLMGEKSMLEGENSNLSFLDESSQSNSMADKPSRPKRARRNSITDIQDTKTEADDGLRAFPAERVFEYQWPQDGGEWYLLQEQVSEYLGVLSFKRKYPDLTRRTCDKLEKDFLREKGVVTETQSDLGLTAVRSDEVYDLMMKDYPEKYHEYAAVLHEREKQKISDKHKEYEVAQPKLEKSKMADYMKKAAKSAAEYNRQFLRERREERLAYFDLQTFMIQYPEGRYKKLPPDCTKPSAYPVALIPGQFQDHYCSYTSDELRYFPVNTVLYDPPKKMKNMLAKPAGSSESSSDDSSEDKSGSTSDGSSSGSGSSDSEMPGTAAANGTISAANTTPAAITPAAPTEATQTPSKTPSKKAGKKVGKTPSKSPAKAMGKTPGKGKRKSEAGGEEREVVSAEMSTPPSPAPEKDKMEEEEEDKDKCRICKNAVLFLKYKRVETKMIKCSECGKIAHPSCLDLTEKMVQVVSTYPWQCMECKTCVECMDPYDEDKMLFCDRCDRGYHTFCVGLRCLPTGRWECRSCKGVAETSKSRRGRALKST